MDLYIYTGPCFGTNKTGSSIASNAQIKNVFRPDSNHYGSIYTDVSKVGLELLAVAN